MQPIVTISDNYRDLIFSTSISVCQFYVSADILKNHATVTFVKIHRMFSHFSKHTKIIQESEQISIIEGGSLENSIPPVYLINSEIEHSPKKNRVNKNVDNSIS